MSDIFRRDPRREWILRNRLHPDHQLLAQPVPESRGPGGLLRKNPHAVGFIGPSGIKRIDRLNVGNLVSLAGRRAAAAPAQAELPLHRVEQPEYVVAVVPDMPGGRLSAHDKDVIGQAHALIRHAGGAGAVLVITFGEHREEGFCAAGADRLLAMTGRRYEGYAPEQCTNALAQIDRDIAPRYWLFPDSIAAGFELGCRLSARLGER
ncbi:electron transfer flavoprotein subunit alpha/FixB family protein, partial [Pluralibacter gergoviae]|nr:electron transfer flavoprotein subunit alpha/FixB family protein [Pluralibacter gergoviae]